jgi:Icc-related predicted phosphoesterase
MRDEARAAFAALQGKVDLVLLAGDLTTHGEPEQAAVLAEAAGETDATVIAVLGNHDHHAARGDELTAVLEEGGVRVLDRSSTAFTCAGCPIGVVGVKGYVGGFQGSHWPDFGEPLSRQVYAETTAEVDALDRGLREIALCPVRIVLMHYAPVEDTLRGEPETIWTMLGSDRLAAPIREHEPDLVLHGHAHAGRFEGRIGAVPVYNVSVPVLGRSFWVFEVAGAERAQAPIH